MISKDYGNYRSQITRSNINNNNAEIQNTFYWSIDVIHWARGVYYPGNEIFYQRLVSVSSLPTYAHQAGEVEMAGGFKNFQPGSVDHTNATPSLIFQDYIDQSIFNLGKDYMDKVEDPETKIGLPKEYLVVDFDIYQLNAALQPIKKYIFRSGVMQSCDGDTEFTNTKQPGGKVTMNWQFEFWDVQLLNKVPGIS